MGAWWTRRGGPEAWCCWLFALSLALKDVRLALEAAGDERLPALACLAAEWQVAVDQVWAGRI